MLVVVSCIQATAARCVSCGRAEHDASGESVMSKWSFDAVAEYVNRVRMHGVAAWTVHAVCVQAVDKQRQL